MRLVQAMRRQRRMQANAPALTAIISGIARGTPPSLAADTNALTLSAAPTWRINCSLIMALPIRAIAAVEKQCA